MRHAIHGDGPKTMLSKTITALSAGIKQRAPIAGDIWRDRNTDGGLVEQSGLSPRRRDRRPRLVSPDRQRGHEWNEARGCATFIPKINLKDGD